jgi:hypothetical protein
MINTNTNTGGDFILAYYIHKKQQEKQQKQTKRGQKWPQF